MSEPASYLNDEYLVRLKDLTASLDLGDSNRVNELVGELTTLRESMLYNEVGKLTRELHDSINSFSDDGRVAALAEEDIPDAKERLEFIVSKTNEAAHRTMNVAEETMDLQYQFMDRTNLITERWKRFRSSQLSKQEFIELSDDLDQFLGSIGEHSSKVNDRMSDIMLAQDYQDITGQMIKQVVNLVQEVQEKLVRLVALSGNTVKPDMLAKKNGEIAEGPQLPDSDTAQVANNQEDVDDLLASLGF